MALGRLTRSYINSFYTGDTHTILDTAVGVARFGRFQFLSLETYRGRQLLVHLGPALPDTLDCLSSVGGPGGHNVSSVFRYFRHLTRF